MDNQKSKKIAFWIVTGLLSFGMLLGGTAQLLRAKFNVDGIVHLGYPEYMLTILGTWKILGTIIILIPKYPLVKEWAYAGLFFLLSGAVISHIVSGDTFFQYIAPLIFTILTVASWYLRPTERKLNIKTN